MADTKVSALTAVTTPAGTDEIPVNQAGTSKKLTLDQATQYSYAYVVLDTAYTLTSTTTAQKIFNASTNGAVTLDTGWYRFNAVIGVTGLSATTGNAQFQVLGGGTATLGGVLYHIVGVDGNSGTAATQTGSWSVASSSAASGATAGTGTALMFNILGTFEVTAQGTIIPSLALVTAAAGSVVVGSFFECKRLGNAGANVTVGSWS
jgi:hypothetical protein